MILIGIASGEAPCAGGVLELVYRCPCPPGVKGLLWRYVFHTAKRRIISAWDMKKIGDLMDWNRYAYASYMLATPPEER